MRLPSLYFNASATGKWTAFAAALVVAVAAAVTPAPSTAQEKKKGGRPPMQVRVDAVIRESIKQTVPVIGRFVARQAGVVAARINGPVGEIRAQVGDKVKAGDVIAVLVNDALKWRLQLQKANERQFQAVVGTFKARIKLRRQELKRLERLEESAAFSQARLDDKRQEVVVAESQLAEAQGRLAGARANRKLAEINLYNATVRAPYPGVITKRHTEVGAYVKIGDPLVTLVDNTHMEIEAEVPGNRTAGLKPSTKVEAYLNNTILITAIVRAVVPDENPQTRTRTVRFIPDFSTHQGELAANQSVTLQLPVNGGGTAVTVHKDAIITRRGKTVVFVAKDSKAELRPVRLGEAVGSRFVVKGGLAPGDKVVVRGNERLKPGQKIRYPEPAAGGTSSSSGGSKAKDKG